jgi:hypothetical protein
MPMHIGISLARQLLYWLRITYKNGNLSDGVSVLQVEKEALIRHFFFISLCIISNYLSKLFCY